MIWLTAEAAAFFIEFMKLIAGGGRGVQDLLELPGRRMPDAEAPDELCSGEMLRALASLTQPSCNIDHSF